jgi:hypothetical protein
MTDVYFFDTVKYCGGVAADEEGNIITEETAPCYRWSGKRNMSVLSLKKYYLDKGTFFSMTKLKCDEFKEDE